MDEVDKLDGEETELMDPEKEELRHEKQSQLALANLRKLTCEIASPIAWRKSLLGSEDRLKLSNRFQVRIWPKVKTKLACHMLTHALRRTKG